MSDKEFLEYIGFGCVLEEAEDEPDRLTSVGHQGFSADEIKRLRYLWCQEPDPFEDIDLHMSHEADPDYLVIPLAISDGSPWEPLPPPLGNGCWAIPLETMLSVLAGGDPTRKPGTSTAGVGAGAHDCGPLWNPPA